MAITSEQQGHEIWRTCLMCPDATPSELAALQWSLAFIGTLEESK